MVRYGQHDNVTLLYLTHSTGRPLKECQYLKFKYIFPAARVTLVTKYQQVPEKDESIWEP
jgi:hypothetical protein